MTYTCKMIWSAVTVSCFIGGCAAKEGGKSVLIGHAKLTLMEAAAIAEKSVPDSHAIKAELTHANNAVVYEVQVLKKVSVDAESGRIISSEGSAPVILELK